jgi:hypothetical protein
VWQPLGTVAVKDFLVASMANITIGAGLPTGTVEIGITVAHLKWNVQSMVGSHIIGVGLTPKRKHVAIAKKQKSASQKRQKRQKLKKSKW